MKKFKEKESTRIQNAQEKKWSQKILEKIEEVKLH